jgi:hypothetical protein
MAEKNNDALEWIITPVLGLLGVAGAFVASMLLSPKDNHQNNNSLPPPPVGGQKPGGCGCQHKKA